MRHPRRRRNVSLVIAGLGVGSMLAAFGLTRMRQGGTVEVLLAVLGFKAAVVGAILALVYQLRVVGRYERLRRGEGVLVRWRIDAARWRTFEQLATTLAQAVGSRPNEMKLPVEVPADGFEVVITHEAFCLGPEFELLEKNAVARLTGPVLEIEQRVPINRYQTRRAVYRLPAPENAQADVARLAQRLTAQAAAARDHVRTFAWIALAVVLGGLVWMVVWAMSVAR